MNSETLTSFVSSHIGGITELAGLIVGIIYLYWEYKGDRRLWIAAIIMPAISLHVYYSSALYADVALNIYYLLFAIYGWWQWNKSKRIDSSEQEFVPRSLLHSVDRRHIAAGIAATGVLWIAIGAALCTFTDTDVPWTNALTAALSIAGMWLLAKKYIEQWWVWIATDIVCCALYTSKQIYFYAILYAIYTVVAVFGWRKWKRMGEQADTAITDYGCFDAVILADGDYPNSPVPLHILSHAPYIICCDAAAETYYKHTRRTPDAIVGDGDSLSPEMKRRFQDIIHIVTEQDYNDLTKATRFAIENVRPANGQLRIAYIGATGKREDHTLGNISLMNFYRREFCITPVMITSHGVFTAHHGQDVIATVPHQQVSIFNMDCTSMQGEGLHWALSPFTEWWQGSLNEAEGNSVTVRADGSYIIYRAGHAKI